MVYADITSGQIAAGEANKQELWTKVKDNFINHEARLVSVEGGVTTAFLDWDWNVSGNYGPYGVRTQVLLQRLNLNVTVSAGRLFIHTAGSAGTSEIDFQFKRGGGAWTSLFSTKPSVAYTAGDYAVSSNGVLNPSYVDLLSGDLVRMNITAVQTNGTGFSGLLSISQTS